MPSRPSEKPIGDDDDDDDDSDYDDDLMRMMMLINDDDDESYEDDNKLIYRALPSIQIVLCGVTHQELMNRLENRLT